MRSPPVPDWGKQKIVLVDPSIWLEYRRRSRDLRPVFSCLVAALDDLHVPYRILRKEDRPLDIWIRDWGTVEGCCFRFAPDYAKGMYTPTAIAKARGHLERVLGRSFRSVPLVLDGGNLVHNGQVAVLTEKVLQDNHHLTRREIEHMILSAGFENVIFIPVEPEDTIGHADGILRFVAPDVLLVNDYAGTELQEYGRKLLRRLNDAKLGCDIIPFPWYTTNEKRNGIWSAVGCYINFLQTAQGIICPSFEHEKDQPAIEVLQQHTKLPVRSVAATALARCGGVLNCASFTI